MQYYNSNRIKLLTKGYGDVPCYEFPTPKWMQIENDKMEQKFWETRKENLKTNDIYLSIFTLVN